MFGALHAADATSLDVLTGVAAEFSPRFEVHGPRDVTIDLNGLARLFGSAEAIARELQRTADEQGLYVAVAIAGTWTAARLLACHTAHSFRPAIVHAEVNSRADVVVVSPGDEADALAPLPLTLLPRLVNGPNDPNDPNGPNDPNVITLLRWGLRTLGELAQLPADAVAARLGRAGVAWQRLARGEDSRPLRPAVTPERFEQSLDLEWPIEGLEPLSFVLGRLIEPLAGHLDRRGRGASVLHVRLHLVTRELHERSLQLPTPMKDARTLRTLALLDLESHPPAAAIDRVVVAVDPTPARVLQFSLLTRPLPSPEQISTLMARLSALMGEGRCGSPADADSWQPGALAMKPFAPSEAGTVGTLAPSVPSPLRTLAPPVCSFRRFRVPVPARVRVDEGRPIRVIADRRGLSGGTVIRRAGPWRTAGQWWTNDTWDHDEWDVTLSDGATYRVFRDRGTNAWFLAGIVD
jgi:protein ImuB